jgi:hypothetical protein
MKNGMSKFGWFLIGMVLGGIVKELEHLKTSPEITAHIGAKNEALEAVMKSASAVLENLGERPAARTQQSGTGHPLGR